MIVIHIIAESKTIADKISDYLIENRLILKPYIINNNQESIIIGRTKALLFEKINQEIKDLNFKTPPIIYSMPVLHMDWDEVSKLQTVLEQV
ncbi:MAG: hypothetical protein ACI8RY_000233 [Urechidicola sp.]|jgi:uncharacterized protein involved in tolerance to divalent cations